MATSAEFIKFVCGQIDGRHAVRYKKMFGEYMVYINDKPILLVCGNTVYVKKAEALAALMQDAETGLPYEGAKEHYILDIENSELTDTVIFVLESITPLPKSRNKTRA